ncbi:DegT/DnrJ/EryC1/StrS family aminotransferase [Aminiphilus circumscriptus]|jgi:8-amino-3,8-dideoxy-alpha-D-manno-octulosonate transaminase|uniref:DegT/DnrJ/EryC1/StrS family aminotransferase n=1 Tax=Aminiphilus circumscriptus TaxID=290732 RepID=UPI000492DB76|nr:DegT/DnrJ/EryC1/StrS family aminotransferase [Aminiphilus circumscriptus]
MPGFELFDQREIDAVADVINRKMVHRYSFVNCRDEIYKVEEFENAVAEKVGAKHCLAVSNGTASLYVALKACGINPGDEIITTPFTFIASVEAILECGAVPVLAEIDESLNLDPTVVEEFITDRTRAIMPVHMFGGAADMEAFRTITRENGLALFEDSCQAMGATYGGRWCGTCGSTWGTYSLDPYKVLTVGEGGLIVTDDEDLYRKMEYYHDHGHKHDKTIDRGAEKKACLGFNFRMSEIQGALGLVQLSKLDGAVEALRKNRTRVLDAVGNVHGLAVRRSADPEGELATQLVFLLPTPQTARRFQKAAKEAGMGCGILEDNTWHYARHWDTLRDGATYSRIRCPYDCPLTESMPLYRPNEWPQTQEILSRAAVFGIDIVMSDEKIESMAKAIAAGARAAL